LFALAGSLITGGLESILIATVPTGGVVGIVGFGVKGAILIVGVDGAVEAPIVGVDGAVVDVDPTFGIIICGVEGAVEDTLTALGVVIRNVVGTLDILGAGVEGGTVAKAVTVDDNFAASDVIESKVSGLDIVGVLTSFGGLIADANKVRISVTSCNH
jgi:hypothetical protein